MHHEDGSPLSLGVWLLDVARCGNLCSEHDEIFPLDFGVPHFQPKPNAPKPHAEGLALRIRHGFLRNNCVGARNQMLACNPGKGVVSDFEYL